MSARRSPGERMGGGRVWEVSVAFNAVLGPALPRRVVSLAFVPSE